MSSASTTSRLQYGPFEFWWSPDQPNEIHQVTSLTAFHDDNGERPGLWTTYSCNPKSANYNPANFNRCARAFIEDGQAAPALVEEHGRRLNRRAKLISEWEKHHGDDGEDGLVSAKV